MHTSEVLASRRITAGRAEGGPGSDHFTTDLLKSLTELLAELFRLSKDIPSSYGPEHTIDSYGTNQ